MLRGDAVGGVTILHCPDRGLRAVARVQLAEQGLLPIDLVAVNLYPFQATVARPEARNQVFNVTYGGARSLNQMAEILREHFPKIEVKYHPRDQLMPERGTLSVDKARRLLGYAPAYPLERGFVGYLDWYKSIAAKNPQLLRPQ